MTLVYDIAIAPLTVLYHFAYTLCSWPLGYGYGLVALSFLTTLVLLPLRRMAAAAGERETRMQAILEPQLKAIRAESRGAERHQRIQRLYRRHGYHPLYSLRASYGLLVQAPLLIAAYYTLMDFAPLESASFWGIADLSRPDGLLPGGVNLLPLAMTGVNLAVIFADAGADRRGRVQAVAIAAVFLLLLYAAPAALLVYWTCNNAFNLALTLRERKRPGRPDEVEDGKPAAKAGERPSGYAAALEIGRKLYWPALFALLALCFFFAPSSLFNASPESFRDATFFQVQYGMFPIMLCFLYSAAYIRKFLPGSWSSTVGLVLGYAALSALFYALAFPPTGVFDMGLFIFMSTWTSTQLYTLDVVVALVLLLVLAQLRRPRLLAAARTLLFLCVASCLVVGVYGAVYPKEVPSALTEGSNDETKKRLFAFSPERPNVVVFMLDMFYGADIGKMMTENPEVLEHFPGFVWYRDMISNGNRTLLSIPSILGGEKYIPLRMNAEGRSLSDQIRDAYYELPLRFLDAGYDVSLLNISIRKFDEREKVEKYQHPRLIERAAWEWGKIMRLERSQQNDWDQDQGGLYKDYALAVSVFRVLPNFGRIMLRGGRFFPNTLKGQAVRNIMDSHLGLHFYMDKFINSGAERPTYKFVHGQLTHFPWGFAKDSLTVMPEEELLEKMESFEAHYNSEVHQLRLLSRFTDWLRENGMYDNTRIILVSDHNAFVDESDIKIPLPTSGNPREVAPFALLMVKDFNADGPLRVSDDPMQTADVPALVCQGLPEIANPPALGRITPDRVRYHSAGSAHPRMHDRDRWKIHSYEIRGPIFDPANWRLMDDGEMPSAMRKQ